MVQNRTYNLLAGLDWNYDLDINVFLRGDSKITVLFNCWSAQLKYFSQLGCPMFLVYSKQRSARSSHWPRNERGISKNSSPRSRNDLGLCQSLVSSLILVSKKVKCPRNSSIFPRNDQRMRKEIFASVSPRSRAWTRQQSRTRSRSRKRCPRRPLVRIYWKRITLQRMIYCTQFKNTFSTSI